MFKIRIISKCYRHLILITLVIFIKGLIADSIQSASFDSSDISLCSNLSFDNIDCSKQNFSSIPKNLPKNAIRLNFSFNNLRILTDETFDVDCCDNITTIDLSNNNIQNISRNSFKHLLKLETLILDSNLLTLLDFNLFSNLTSLKSLSLNNNRIQLTRPDDPTKGFLNSKSLLVLNLDSCSIDQIPLSTFNYLNQLTSLSLANNPINKHIEVASFKPLATSLEHLRLPTVSDRTVFQLCDTLKAVDGLILDLYNVSCFLLYDKTNVQDGIVTNDRDYIIEEPRINFVIESTKVESPRLPKDTIPISRLPEVSNTAMKNETIKNFNTNVPSDNQSITLTLTSTTTTTTTQPDIEMEKSTFDISNETLKMVLIGIFAVAVFGVVLGIVCRYCGIKSKLCHTTKKRTTNADTVASFEMENLNGNGKNSQTLA